MKALSGCATPMNGNCSSRRKLSSALRSGRPPGDVGERANRYPEPLLGRGFAGSEKSGPRHELSREFRHPREVQPDELRPLDKGIEILLLAAQLRVEKPFAQAERGKDDALGTRMFQDPVHDQRRRRQRARPAFRHARRRRQFRRGNPRDRSCEFARFDRAERIAVHDLDRRAGRLHVRFRERPPAAAHRIKHRPRQRAGKAASQDIVDSALRRRKSLDSIASTGSAPSGRLTQRSPT